MDLKTAVYNCCLMEATKTKEFTIKSLIKNQTETLKELSKKPSKNISGSMKYAFRKLVQEDKIVMIKKGVYKMKDEPTNNKYDIHTVEECVVCLDNKPGVLLVECGHICCCALCLSKLQSPECPVCRTNIGEFIYIDII